MTQIPYHHRISTRARHLRLSFDRQGAVVVTTPPRCSLKLIEEFVTEHQAWIAHHQRQFTHKKQSIISDHHVSIFGTDYPYEIQPLSSNSLPVGVHLRDNRLIHVITAPSQAAAGLNRFLKHTAQTYITTRVHSLAKLMETTVEKLSFREQSSRWGSCTRSGHLSFNWRLVHYPPPVIDYVIIHELAHRFELNHSDRFWRIVARFDPQYQERRRYLRRHGLSVG